MDESTAGGARGEATVAALNRMAESNESLGHSVDGNTKAINRRPTRAQFVVGLAVVVGVILLALFLAGKWVDQASKDRGAATRGFVTNLNECNTPPPTPPAKATTEADKVHECYDQQRVSDSQVFSAGVACLFSQQLRDQAAAQAKAGKQVSVGELIDGCIRGVLVEGKPYPPPSLDGFGARP